MFRVDGASRSAYLIWSGTDRKFALLEGQTWAIGRGEGCAVLLHSRAVSRLHALIQRRDSGDYFLVDLGSRNGSFVNGRRVSEPAQLHDNDHLVFAEQELVFRNPEGTISEPLTPVTESRDLPTSAMLVQSLTTIVVVDIREFTRLARSLSEVLLSQTIGTWFFRVGKVAERWGSWKQQYMGDAVMAVWVHENKANVGAELMRVLRAVCEMDQVTSEISRSLPLPGLLRIGAGVNTGLAILGGTYYTALGDTVNVAMRLEAATKTVGLGVVLGESTFETLIAPPPLPFKRVDVKVKGHDQPVAAWGISFQDLDSFLNSVDDAQLKSAPTPY
jgi:adenylate cyclase